MRLVILLVVVLLASCSSGPQGVAQVAGSSPQCTWHVTIASGGEGARDGSTPPQESAPTLCHDCRIEMDCLFDRTSSAPGSDQVGNRTHTEGQLQGQVPVSIGGNASTSGGESATQPAPSGPASPHH